MKGSDMSEILAAILHVGSSLAFTNFVLILIVYNQIKLTKLYLRLSSGQEYLISMRAPD